MMMTDRDKDLVRAAQDQRDWTMIDEDSAETEEGKKELHSICMNLYHREEYAAGCY